MDKAQQTIKHKAQKEAGTIQTTLGRKLIRKTVEETQADKSPPRVRSPSDQWTRVRLRRNLLPPEQRGDTTGAPPTAEKVMKNRSNRAIFSTIRVAYPINASKQETIIFNPAYTFDLPAGTPDIFKDMKKPEDESTLIKGRGIDRKRERRDD